VITAFARANSPLCSRRSRLPSQPGLAFRGALHLEPVPEHRRGRVQDQRPHHRHPLQAVLL